MKKKELIAKELQDRMSFVSSKSFRILRIAINTRFLLPNKLEGFGWYTLETVSRICRNHPEHEFIFFFDRPYDQKFIFSDNITPVVLNPQARHPLLQYCWFQYSVTKALKKYKADLFLSPDGYLSLKTAIPSVAVIHDINFEHYPKDLRWLTRNYYRRFFPRFAQKAKRIITVSEFSKADICNTYKIDPSKIDVIYNGVGNGFKVFSNEENEQTKLKFSKGKPYFLFVGALTPRKNLNRLFLAFDEFKKKNKSDIKLLIVGEKYFWNHQVQNAFSTMEFKDDVLFTGHLHSNELSRIYSAALGLTFISYFEGFGLPLVEAMKSEIPILCANTSASPEIAGNAAIYCDPFKHESIVAGLETLAFDREKRKEIIEEGKTRIKLFNWDNNAKLLWESLMKSINA